MKHTHSDIPKPTKLYQRAQARAIANRLYMAYGSDTGYLFGLPPSARKAVETIVLATIRELPYTEGENE